MLREKFSLSSKISKNSNEDKVEAPAKKKKPVAIFAPTEKYKEPNSNAVSHLGVFYLALLV